MSRRVTVIGTSRRVDATLPEALPVVELLSDLVDMLGEGGASDAVPWGLVRVGGKVLDPELSLADQGVDEGTMLFLRDLTVPPPPPTIADYAEGVAIAVDAQGGRWAGAMVPTLLVSLAGATLAAAGLLDLVTRDRNIAGLVGAAGVALSVITALVLVRVARRSGLAEIVMLCSLPLWAAAGVGIADVAGWPPTAVVATALGGAAIGSIAAVLIVGDIAATAAAAIVALTGPPALVVAACAALGTGLAAAAAVLAPVELVLLAMIAPLTVRLSGVASASPQSLGLRLRRARHALAASLIGTATVLTLSCAITSVSGGWYGRVLVGVTALAMTTRARHFRFAAEVAPLLAGAAASLLLLEIPAAAWLATGPDAVMLLAGLFLIDALVLVVVATVVPRWMLTPRITSRLWLLESLAIAASVPLALGAIGAFDAVARFARGLV